MTRVNFNWSPQSMADNKMPREGGSSEPEDAEKIVLEKTNLRLANDKLRLEIKQLGQAWRSPAAVLGAVAAIATAGAFLIQIRLLNIDLKQATIEKTKAEDEKIHAENDKARALAEKVQADSEKAKALAEKLQAENDKTKALAEKAMAEKERDQITTEATEQKKELARVSVELAAKKTELTKVVDKLGPLNLPGSTVETGKPITVEGTILNHRAEPFPGAIIEAIRDGVVLATVTADFNGQFAMHIPSAAPAKLQIDSGGLTVRPTVVRLDGDSNQRVRVVLPTKFPIAPAGDLP
jgi:hypothetical protein